MSENQKNQSENKIEENASFFSLWKSFIFAVFLFALTLALGTATAFRMHHFSLNFVLGGKNNFLQISFWQFILNFSLVTAIFLSIIYFFSNFKARKRFFRSFFIIAIFFGCLIFLENWIKEPASLIITTLFVFWWWKSPLVLNQNILIIFGMAGAGSILGLSLEPKTIILLLIVFSIYDFIAVYKTKHMIKIAREMIESRAILALVIPANILEFQESLEKIQPGGKFLILGGGDIIFSLMLSTSLIPEGVLNSIIIAIFSLIGLFFSFYFFVSKKTRQPIPALPPIALSSIIGYFITKIL